MDYVKIIGEAFRWHIHKIVNESTKHQLKQHFTLEKIYGNLPKVSDVVRMRRNPFTGHCLRAKEQIISVLLFWSLPHQKRGRKPLSYPETLVRYNDTDITDLVNITEKRNLWKRLADSHLDHGCRK